LTASGRVLVTGANGNLGRRLLRRLAGERPVRAVVRSERAAAAVRAAGAEPAPPVTPAMLEVVDQDDCVDPAEACRRLGIVLTSLDEMLLRSVVRAGAA
jgi:uncharacterized protein YbjT (DUF2867 family)